MGLGKTIQVIAFMAAVLNKKGLKEDLYATRPDCVKKVTPQKVEYTENRRLILLLNILFYFKGIEYKPHRKGSTISNKLSSVDNRKLGKRAQHMGILFCWVI